MTFFYLSSARDEPLQGLLFVHTDRLITKEQPFTACHAVLAIREIMFERGRSHLLNFPPSEFNDATLLGRCSQTRPLLVVV
jgi:hypothetical protein